ncbi:Cell wall assembly regulator SMI1 [Actinopolyspora alba]|uniref:Cell wall assembly regulator SMI1 n=1 Tax=Actinopolyspora alba TaxID=673379 RepID=A0A1I1TYH5_9ACTN|nr:SMI1/KNR4 family protein [Actinopolyspora alba]SFD62368.1 Cell wall assembly regulator SMI1 [Actinopolyspora alba]
MDVTLLWTKITLWLAEYAPTTASELKQALPPPDMAAFESEFELTLPQQLKEWWSCCGGTESGSLTDVLPPFYTPYGASGAWRVWCEFRETWAAKWHRPACDYYAGSAGSSFHPAWIPIAGDGFADELVVDLRPGPLRGCVLEWEQEMSRVGPPLWADLASMLADVHRALTEGGSAGYSRPTVTEDGRLDWQIR